MSKKKVLHLLQSNTFSGAENVVCQIISLFRDSDEYEMIYCSRDGQIRTALEDRQIQFESVKQLSLSEIKRVIQKVCPDIIHAHDRTAAFYAGTACGKIPVIVHMHVNNNKGLQCLLKNIVFTLVSKKYRHIFWVSDSAKEEFQFRNLIERKSSVLYNVLDKTAILQKADEDYRTYSLDVIYVGRLCYQKNPERLLRVLEKAARCCPEAYFGIIGSGDMLEYVQNVISTRNLSNVVAFGYMNNPLKALREAKVMVMTSRFEGTPMTVIEAQILGVPLVSTPVDGINRIVVDGVNGFLSNDDDVLVKKIVQLLENTSIQREMSENCQKMIKRYIDTNGFHKRIQYKYEEVLNERMGGAV